MYSRRRRFIRRFGCVIVLSPRATVRAGSDGSKRLYVESRPQLRVPICAIDYNPCEPPPASRGVGERAHATVHALWALANSSLPLTKRLAILAGPGLALSAAYVRMYVPLIGAN